MKTWTELDELSDAGVSAVSRDNDLFIIGQITQEMTMAKYNPPAVTVANIKAHLIRYYEEDQREMIERGHTPIATPSILEMLR